MLQRNIICGDKICFKGCEHFKLLMEDFGRFSTALAFIVQEVEDPRHYGVIEVKEIEDACAIVPANRKSHN